MKTLTRPFQVLVLAAFCLTAILASCRLQGVRGAFKSAEAQNTQITGSGRKAASGSGSILSWVSNKINEGSGFGFSEPANYTGTGAVNRINYGDYSETAEMGAILSGKVINTLVKMQTITDAQDLESDLINVSETSVNQLSKNELATVHTTLAEQYILREAGNTSIQDGAAIISKLRKDKILAEEARAALSNSGLSIEAARQKYAGL